MSSSLRGVGGKEHKTSGMSPPMAVRPLTGGTKGAGLVVSLGGGHKRGLNYVNWGRRCRGQSPAASLHGIILGSAACRLDSSRECYPGSVGVLKCQVELGQLRARGHRGGGEVCSAQHLAFPTLLHPNTICLQNNLARFAPGVSQRGGVNLSSLDQPLYRAGNPAPEPLACPTSQGEVGEGDHCPLL